MITADNFNFILFTDIGVKNIKIVGYGIPLSELGLDSMMSVEIRQTLRRDFDIDFTSQDIRNFTFAKLHDIAEKHNHVEKEADSIVNMQDVKLHFRMINNLDIIPDICLEIPTKQKVGGERIFFLPGIEGSRSSFNSLSSKINAPATCLQHGANNIPTSDSVVQSAATLFPVRKNDIITNLCT